jgi:hypothetical protein
VGMLLLYPTAGASKVSTQELVYNFPKLNRRSLKRKFKYARSKTERYAKAKMRKTKSVSTAYLRRQYFINTARLDAQRAIAQNEDIFIGTSIISVLVGYSFAVKATDFLLLFFQTAYEAAGITGISMFFLAFAAIGTLSVLFAWIAAFTLNMQSIALMEGANGKQHRSIRRTVRIGLQHASRITTVWALLLAIMVAPLVLVAITAYTYISVAAMSMKEVLALAPAAGVVSAIAVLVVLLQFSLAPYAALFEPHLTILQTLKRSRQLLMRRGRLFLLFTYLAFAGALAGVYGISLALQALISIPTIVTLGLGATALFMALNGILVMLYRKRKLARKN